jgi:peroxiredoxin
MKNSLLFLSILLLSTFWIQAQDSLRLYFFLAEDCPICRYYAGEMQQFYADYQEKGVAFRGVFPVETSSKASIDAFQAAFEIPFPLVKDVNQYLTQKYDARVTPEAILALGDSILYRGRIDNRFDRPGRQRRHVTQRELRDALEAVVGGEAVAVRETQAVGCFITRVD